VSTYTNIPAVSSGSGATGRFGDLAADMLIAVSTLTDFIGFGPTMYPASSPAAGYTPVDGALRGGAVTAANTSAAVLCNASLFNAVPTQSWAVGIRGSLQVSTAGHQNFLGFLSLASNCYYVVATYSTLSATNYILYTFKTGPVEKYTVSTLACDGNVHNFVVAFDANTATLKLRIDGTERATLADTSALLAANVYIGCYNDVQGEAKMCLGGVGYVTP
jgi:hypothetical protein